MGASGGAIAIDDAWRAEYTAAYESFGAKGERVLGFAYLEVSTLAPHHLWYTVPRCLGCLGWRTQHLCVAHARRSE